MQAWQTVAKGMGGSAQDAVSTLQAIGKGMAESRSGPASAFTLAAMKYGVGISGTDTPEQAMLKVFQKIYEIKQKGGQQLAMVAANALGVSSFSMQQYAMEDPAERATQYAEAMKNAGGITKQTSKESEDLLFKWALFSERMTTIKYKIFDKLAPTLEKLADQLVNFLDSVDWDKVIAKVGELFTRLQQIVQALGGVKGILIEIAAIKVFGWVASIGMWVLKLRSLTMALTAARAAAAAGGVAGAVGGAAGAAGGAAEGAAAGAGAGLAAKAIPIATRISMWALPIWALFHSESTGGKQRANGTYEDEFDWSSPEGQAAIAKQKAAQKTAATRGMRNNNPGNIKYGAFARSMGATGQDMGGFAVFPTAQAGIAAIAANLRSYGRKGFDTPSEIAHRWSTTDQAAYTKTLAALFGGNANKQLDMSNKSVLAALTNAIISQENGANPYLGMVNSYVGAPRGTQAKTTTNTNTVTINGPINVNAPKATNADGIAKGMRKGLQDNPLIAGSVTALA